MLKMPRKKLSKTIDGIKAIAYAEKDNKLSTRLLALARLLGGNTITGGFPEPVVMRDTVLLMEALGLQFAVIGGIAVAIHGMPRGTDDIDLLVDKMPDASAIRDKDFMCRFNFYPSKSHTGTILIIDHKHGQIELLAASDPLRKWALNKTAIHNVLGVDVPVIEPEAVIATKAQAVIKIPRRLVKDKSDIVAIITKQQVDMKEAAKYLSKEEKAFLRTVIPDL